MFQILVADVIIIAFSHMPKTLKNEQSNVRSLNIKSSTLYIHTV